MTDVKLLKLTSSQTKKKAKMSDINDADDLLNYELLGELDEHALLGDEDDLLLSDEDVDKEKSKKNVENKLSTKSNDVLKNKRYVENKSIKSNEMSRTKSREKLGNRSDTPVKNKKTEQPPHSQKNVSTSNIVLPSVNTNETLKSEEKSKIWMSQSGEVEEEARSQNNEVSSTNKEIKTNENEYLAVSQESTNLEELNYEPDGKDEDSEENPGERLNIKQASERDDIVDSSPEKNQPNVRYPYAKRGRGRGGGPPFLPRMHIPNIRFPFNNRHSLGCPIKSDNSNPQQAMQQGQFPSSSLLPYSNEMQGQIPLPRQPYPPPNHAMNPRMDFPHHRPMGPNFIPQNSNENVIGPRMYRQRHPPPNGMMPPYNGPQSGNLMRPMYRPNDPNQLRPRMPLRPQAPVPLGIQNNPNYMSQPVNQIPQSHLMQSNIGGSSHQNAPSNSSVLPRKVLINPNFKGGVEAATNQLMKDTQFIQTISSHVSHLQSDEELLRQQEEFIKKNQIQIDKRRYARSPGRSRTRSRSRSRSRGRVRSRERSYSPPRRREFYRDRRGGFRGIGGRNRRGGSREWENDRRRRSFSPDRINKDRNHEEEDEETRAYRLEIEKQKAMREKILKDKEMRRRKAAEDKLNEDKIEEPTKLKPIVVTESKIISLKKVKDKNELESGANNNNKVSRGTSNNKKSSSVTNAAKSINLESNSPQRPIKRSIPTAKILPDAKRSLTEHIKKDIAVSTTSGSNTIKSTAQSTTSSTKTAATTAIVKPVMKKSTTVQTDISKKQQKTNSNSDDMLEDYDDELLEEDRLLASPTPSPSNTPELEDNDDDDDVVENNNYDNNNSDNEDFVDEELLKKPKKSFMSSNRKVLLKPFHKNDNIESTTKKRVFDRLEKPKPKVSVKESAKKRIQRIIE